jgi:hypothetical protein
MANRTRWQYCQVEVGTNTNGFLKQFFADRQPVESDLHQNWPAMIAKLGEQGWELVGVLPNESGRGRSPLTYVFKREMPGSGSGTNPATPPPVQGTPPSQPPPEPSAPSGPVQDFEPLDF